MPLSAPLTRAILALGLTMTCAAVVGGAGDGIDDFTRSWNGRRVAVRSALYSVVYDEVGRLGMRSRNKLAGLTVATVTGQHYEFDGPGSGEDISEPTPNRVFSEMAVRFYRSSDLDIGNVKTITPVLLRQYEPGVTLVVESVKMDGNRLRFEFRRADDQKDQFATSLTVEWPVPLSRAFGEREAVEGVVRRFVEPL
jgi:hypothetical protein